MDIEVQPHIKLSKKDVEPVAIVVGDWRRAEAIAVMSDSHTELQRNREYVSYRCVINGQPITAISHGVGSAGCCICIEELIKCGVKCIIRAGTCGSLRPKHIVKGDIFIAVAAADRTGIGKEIVPSGTPAISDPEVFQELKKQARALSTPFHEGVIMSYDVFYPSPCQTEPVLEQYSKVCETIEMELSPIFYICRYRNVRAGGIFTVDGCPLKWDEGEYHAHDVSVDEAKKRMLKVAMNTCAEIRKEYS